MSRVYVVIVNWNGWIDTLECLESVFHTGIQNCRVIVCDNASNDGSLDYIKAWADNRLDLVVRQNSPLRGLTYPPRSKPIDYCEYQRTEAESGGTDDENASLVLINTGINLGFAGGNNVGLRYVLARNDFDYIWLLNNDTVVQRDALTYLLNRMREKPDAGMCGSTLFYYNKPEKIQLTGGGYYCKWIGLPWHLGRLKKAGDPINRGRVERWMNYVSGASMLVSRQMLQDVGLMCEDYFLYYEELDWALRAKDRYSLAYAPSSIVYHKVGASIGTSSRSKNKSYTCDYFNIRNRLFFTRKFFPSALPANYLILLGALMLRIMLGKWDRVTMMLKLFTRYTNPVNIRSNNNCN